MLQPIPYILYFTYFPSSSTYKTWIEATMLGCVVPTSVILRFDRFAAGQWIFYILFWCCTMKTFWGRLLQDRFTTICFWKIFRGWLRPTFPNLRATFLVSRVSTMFRLMFIANVRTNVRHQELAEDRPQCLCPNLFRNKNFFESKHSESIFVLHNLPKFSKQHLSLSAM